MRLWQQTREQSENDGGSASAPASAAGTGKEAAQLLGAERRLVAGWVADVEAEVRSLKQMGLAAKVMAHVASPTHKKLLNLCHDWLKTFMPHCLAKVNR